MLTALGPALLPGVLSYGGYRLECALRSATLLGVFGLGGLGTELKLTMQSLAFHELWTGLWLLLAVMLSLEAGLGGLRRRWLMPVRFGLQQPSVGLRAREMVLVLLALLPLSLLLGQALGVQPQALFTWQPLPPLQNDWPSVLAMPWPALVGGTLALTLLAACLAVGLAPLLLLLAAPSRWLRAPLRLVWALGRLWPPPLTALLLLLVLQPGVVTGALALGFHNLGVLGRLLLESAADASPATEQALACAGSGPRLALLYGRLSVVARPYLAYAAYRSDVMLRESVVVSLVGATGLGSQLLESLSAFAWDQLLALVVVYALLTLVGKTSATAGGRGCWPAVDPGVGGAAGWVAPPAAQAAAQAMTDEPGCAPAGYRRLPRPIWWRWPSSSRSALQCRRSPRSAAATSTTPTWCSWWGLPAAPMCCSASTPACSASPGM